MADVGGDDVVTPRQELLHHAAPERSHASGDQEAHRLISPSPCGTSISSRARSFTFAQPQLWYRARFLLRHAAAPEPMPPKPEHDDGPDPCPLNLDAGAEASPDTIHLDRIQKTAGPEPPIRDDVSGQG